MCSNSLFVNAFPFCAHVPTVQLACASGVQSSVINFQSPCAISTTVKVEQPCADRTASMNRTNLSLGSMERVRSL
jgi:hypothetical protein